VENWTLTNERARGGVRGLAKWVARLLFDERRGAVFPGGDGWQRLWHIDDINEWRAERTFSSKQTDSQTHWEKAIESQGYVSVHSGKYSRKFKSLHRSFWLPISLKNCIFKCGKNKKQVILAKKNWLMKLVSNFTCAYHFWDRTK